MKSMGCMRMQLTCLFATMLVVAAVGPGVADAADPLAVNDSVTIDEDQDYRIDVTANDVFDVGATRRISSHTQPANGFVYVEDDYAPSKDNIIYEPDEDYCNDGVGDSPDIFTYTVPAGSTATVSVTVRCINDRPIPDDDGASVFMNSTANVIEVLDNDFDPEGDPFGIYSLLQPANGSAQIIPGTPDKISYTPKNGYCGSDPFEYQAADGGEWATVYVTVFCRSAVIPRPPSAPRPLRPTTRRDTVAPTLSKFVAHKRKRAFDGVSVISSEAGQARLRIYRKSGKRYRLATTRAAAFVAGANRLPGFRLKRGTYRLELKVTDAANNESAVERTSLKLK